MKTIFLYIQILFFCVNSNEISAQETTFDTSLYPFGDIDYKRFIGLDGFSIDTCLVGYWNPKFLELPHDTALLLPEWRRQVDFAYKEDLEPLQLFLKELEVRILFSDANISNAYLFTKIQDGLKYMGKHQNVGMEAVFEKYLADFYLNREKNYALALQHYEKMLALSISVTVKEYPSKLFNMNRLAYNYKNFGDHENAIDVSKLLMSEQQRDTFNYWDFTPLNLYRIGQEYYELGAVDSAFYYVHEAVRVASAKRDTFEMGHAIGKLGELYYKIGDFANAVANLSESLHYYRHLDKDPETETKIVMFLADALLRKGRLNETVDMVDYVEKRGLDISWPVNRPMIYRLLSRHHTALGNISHSLAYADSSAYWEEKIRSDFDRIQLIRGEQQMELDRLQIELDERTQRRNMLIIILCSFFIMLYMIYKFRVYKIRADLTQKNDELRSAKLSLERFKSEVLKKSDLLLQAESRQEEGKQYKLLVNDLKAATILTPDQWEDFKKLFDKVHHGFFDSIREFYPQVTPSEVRYLALKKLDLTNKEMANTLGVTEQSIRTTQYRINRKLSDMPDVTISSLIS